jgi:SAM-dependent methyltransferase
MSEFDRVADRYEQELLQGLKFTGESSEYFARGRVELLANRLAGKSVERVLDFGCGVGTALPLLATAFPGALIVGSDISAQSLDIADRKFRAQQRIRLVSDTKLGSEGPFDVVYCNGVFHHIPPKDRRTAALRIARLLTEGGHFALWENNPWNPGTRFVMWRIPFDREAEPLSILAARALLKGAGFSIVDTTFAFVFPAALRVLRPIERVLLRAPVGAQYQVLARRCL